MYPTKEILLKVVKNFDGLYSLKKYNINRKLYKIDNHTTNFFFPKVEDFNFWVKEYYMKYADNISIVKNILKEDSTTNYKVTYNLDRIEDIFNMNILNNYNNYIAVKNYSLQEILAIASESQIFKNCIIHNIDISLQQSLFKEIKTSLKLDEKKL